ncbi:MAG: Crp/Fnr family transcriptional regulator [Sphingobacteriia bacterium]|nr:Crp/Fnr family transcriptional regulator [Sphingobacteriia bacterium]
MAIDINTLLAWGATYKKVAEGEIIFNEGGHCSFYHQLVSGSIRWMNINDEGKETLQVMIEPGESFGDLPLFDDGPYAATSVANEAAVIIRLNKTTFLQLLKENPDIHFAFSRLLCEHIRFKFLIVRALAEHNPEKAIACLFAYFKQKKKNICSKCNKVKLTRQQIADMLGLRVETVIRTIRVMHEKGDVLVDKGKVYC